MPPCNVCEQNFHIISNDTSTNPVILARIALTRILRARLASPQSEHGTLKCDPCFPRCARTNLLICSQPPMQGLGKVKSSLKMDTVSHEKVNLSFFHVGHNWSRLLYYSPNSTLCHAFVPIIKFFSETGMENVLTTTIIGLTGWQNLINEARVAIARRI